MRNIYAGVNAVLKIADTFDKHGFYAYADVLHSMMRRMANEEAYYDDGWQPPPDEEQLSWADLERYTWQEDLFELIMKREHSPEGLTMEEQTDMRLLMHLLQGGDYKDFERQNYHRTPEDQKFIDLIRNEPPIVQQIQDMSADNEY
jgi:hypothetical protein